MFKSINQYYNKRRAEIQSIYDKEPVACLLKDKKVIYRKTGRTIQILTVNRNNKIKDIIHKYSRFIINYCIQQNVGTIVIGYDPEWKQNINLGKKNNQNFVQIAYTKLMKNIKYKAEEIGINVKEQEESHTSKCSFLDNEHIGHSGKYVGKRISRGLFRSLNGIIINADVQGGYNIIKKAIPKAFEKLVVLRADGIERYRKRAQRATNSAAGEAGEGVGLHPLRINPLSINRNISIVGG